jgi:hypothetical protein
MLLRLEHLVEGKKVSRQHFVNNHSVVKLNGNLCENP